MLSMTTMPSASLSTTIRLCFSCLEQPSLLMLEQLRGQEQMRSVQPSADWLMNFFRFSPVSSRSSSVRLRMKFMPVSSVPSQSLVNFTPQMML